MPYQPAQLGFPVPNQPSVGSAAPSSSIWPWLAVGVGLVALVYVASRSSEEDDGDFYEDDEDDGSEDEPEEEDGDAESVEVEE